MHPLVRTILVLILFLATAARSAEKPNLIFILSDDLAMGDLGCYGQKLIQTPHLDRMAREGTRYTQAYCGTSVCAPSRASLMTGLHSGHGPIRANWEIAPGEGQQPLPAGTVTVAQILKGVVSMKLLERQDGKGRIAALEIMRASPKLSKMIERGETADLHEEVESSVGYYRMQSMNQSLLSLLVHGTISYELLTALGPRVVRRYKGGA